MARYRGPRAKISRRYAEPIFGKSKAAQKKAYPPGEHGRGRRRMSEYAIQLAEKQKMKYTYGVLERQFSVVFHRAERQSGITGENLLRLLECRLDNMVYRLKIAPTRRSARQLVRHGHICVNDEVVDIPSYNVMVKDIVSIRTRSQSLACVQDSLAEPASKRLPWLAWDDKLKQGRILDLPKREDIPENIKEQLIVELYSK